MFSAFNMQLRIKRYIIGAIFLSQLCNCMRASLALIPRNISVTSLTFFGPCLMLICLKVTVGRVSKNFGVIFGLSLHVCLVLFLTTGSFLFLGLIFNVDGSGKFFIISSIFDDERALSDTC